MAEADKGRPLTIGRLARAAGVNVETIRYYQREGLLAEPEKPPQGYRVYPWETVARLHFIRRAKQLGFTLREIRDLLSLDEGHCREVRQLAREKAAEIESRIRDLDSMLKALHSLLERCDSSGQAEGRCGLLDALKHRPDPD